MNVVFPVLLYHSVSDTPPRDGAWGAVSSKTFASHVEAITASGRQPVSLNAVAAALRGEGRLPERPVTVTFDDGYADTFAAAELLSRRGLCCSIYVTTGKIGAPGRLAAEQITRLAEMPDVELGSHGVHHERLDELDEAAIARELGESKSRLEHLTGRVVNTFAYPHGSFDRRVRSAAMVSGYSGAAAVKNALSHPDDDPFAVARWTVTERTSPERLADVLDGAYAPLGWASEPWRTRAYRAARRQRRRVSGIGSGRC